MIIQRGGARIPGHRDEPMKPPEFTRVNWAEDTYTIEGNRCVTILFTEKKQIHLVNELERPVVVVRLKKNYVGLYGRFLKKELTQLGEQPDVFDQCVTLELCPTFWFDITAKVFVHAMPFLKRLLLFYKPIHMGTMIYSLQWIPFEQLTTLGVANIKYFFDMDTRMNRLRTIISKKCYPITHKNNVADAVELNVLAPSLTTIRCMHKKCLQFTSGKIPYKNPDVLFPCDLWEFMLYMRLAFRTVCYVGACMKRKGWKDLTPILCQWLPLDKVTYRDIELFCIANFPMGITWKEGRELYRFLMLYEQMKESVVGSMAFEPLRLANVAALDAYIKNYGIGNPKRIPGKNK